MYNTRVKHREQWMEFPSYLVHFELKSAQNWIKEMHRSYILGLYQIIKHGCKYEEQIGKGLDILMQ